MSNILTRAAIEEAHQQIQPYIIRTPVKTSDAIDKKLRASIFFKCENLQICGVFKPRGASNAVFSLTEEEAARGVATHSSGNHAQALAYAAKKRGIESYIVMPRTAQKIKVEAVRSHGAEITFCEPFEEAREEAVAKVVERTGACFIHPYDNMTIIAGQATCTKELVEDIPDLDMIIGPVGGGGLMSGTCLAIRHWSPETRVVGAEPMGADDAYRSLKAGRIIPSIEPKTSADGLLTSLCDITFDILSRHLEGIVRVSEENMIEAMKLIHRELGMVVEPSGATSLAALLEGELDITGKRIGIIISGGNIDPDRFLELTSRKAEWL
ncbi:MAG: pyridoxal-phosphate dependent enzyme [Thermoplasmata archaeon]|nr:pyridoxal-phosphate dependent enzyme [Thermoplasmata archaeon]